MDKKKTLKLAVAFAGVATLSGCAVGHVGVIDHGYVAPLHIDVVPLQIDTHYVSPHYNYGNYRYGH